MKLSLPAQKVDWEALPPQRCHEIQLQVQATDLDDLHHVNNTVYLTWCERVAREHALRLGLDTPAFVELGAVAVAREHLIRFLKPALLGDQVRVRTALVQSAGVRSVRVYTIDRIDPPDDLPVRLAECQTEWAWVNPASGRPTRIPQEVLQRFGFDS